MDQDRSLFDLEVDPATGEEMLETSRWQKMLGIIVMISIVLVLLTLLLGWTRIALLMEDSFASGESQATIAFLAVILLLVAIVAGIMAGLLIRGAGRIKTAIRTKEQALFNNGLGDLKTFFIIYGVISILGLLGNLANFF